MTQAKIQNYVVSFLQTDILIAAIRQSFVGAGFPLGDYDNWVANSVQYWVLEYSGKMLVGGKIYLCFSYDYNTDSSTILSLNIYLNWDVTHHVGIGGLNAATQLDMRCNENTPFPLVITSIDHPELKGFIWQQDSRSGTLFFLEPALSFFGYGMDGTTWGWYFVTSDFLTLHQAAGTFNPFGGDGSYNLETWTNLSYKVQSLDEYQLQCAPSIPSPDFSGFVGQFSPDICLCPSYGLPVKAALNDGLNNYTLIRPRNYSGVAIAS